MKLVNRTIIILSISVGCSLCLVNDIAPSLYICVCVCVCVYIYIKAIIAPSVCYLLGCLIKRHAVSYMTG